MNDLEIQEKTQELRVMHADCPVCDLVITEPIIVDLHTKHVKNLDAEERVSARMDTHIRLHRLQKIQSIVRMTRPTYN